MRDHGSDRLGARAATAGPLPPAPGLRAVVVVPARDEQALIGRCLRALAAQQGLPPHSHRAIVVLDGCRDGTAAAVRQFRRECPQMPVEIVELPESVGVGRARRRGMDLACRDLISAGHPRGLIATTDADSVVAEDWLAAQLGLVEDGAQAIGGHIELLDEDAAAPVAIAERKSRAPGRLSAARAGAPAGALSEHHHFSGASLALTAETYLRCGGLPVRAALEDEALERELRMRGVPIHRSRSVRVMTSARTDGRAPRGLAHDLARSSWRARRSYTAARFPLDRLLAVKDRSIGLILPTREVAATVGPIAAQAARLRDLGLLDEVLVVDAGSRDGSARIAAAAGVWVAQQDELSPELGPARGKGDAMWRGLRELSSEIVAFVDTDTEDFGEHFITGLLGPLICDPQVRFVKGFFRRPFRSGPGQAAPDGGGRVTELMARPLLNLHAPQLAVFDQPLAGETAARRELLEQLRFSVGYGVEIAMLIDAGRVAGIDALAQVDLGVRQNRHQPLRDLSAMAYAVLVAAQARFLGPEFADAHAAGSIVLPPLPGEQSMESRRVAVEERPSLRELEGGGAPREPATPPERKSRRPESDDGGERPGRRARWDEAELQPPSSTGSVFS
jgi:glucosyl-3-phosphoglycerate synthase